MQRWTAGLRLDTAHASALVRAATADQLWLLHATDRASAEAQAVELRWRELSQSTASLLSRVAEMLNLWTPAYVYNMAVEGSRNELVDALWTGEYMSAVGRFSSVNAEFIVSFFEELQLDGSTADH